MEEKYPEFGIKCPLCQTEKLHLVDVKSEEEVRKYADSAYGSPMKQDKEEASMRELKDTLREEEKEDLKLMSSMRIKQLIPEGTPEKFMGYTDFGSVPRRMRMTALSRKSNYIYERMQPSQTFIGQNAFNGFGEAPPRVSGTHAHGPMYGGTMRIARDLELQGDLES